MNALVVSPHPDDETLGCGGILLRHRAKGDITHWAIVTALTTEGGYTEDQIARRAGEIDAVRAHYRFSSVHELGLLTARLDVYPIAELVQKLATVFTEVMPEVVYLPHGGDVHSDHSIVSHATIACTKWFRHSSVRRVLAYETLSETDFAIDPTALGFRPNVYVDISEYLDEKISISKAYAEEIHPFPFPRSEQAIRALASVRGTAAGCAAAEAFMLLKEIL